MQGPDQYLDMIMIDGDSTGKFTLSLLESWIEESNRFTKLDGSEPKLECRHFC